MNETNEFIPKEKWCNEKYLISINGQYKVVDALGFLNEASLSTLYDKELKIVGEPRR